MTTRGADKSERIPDTNQPRKALTTPHREVHNGRITL